MFFDTPWQSITAAAGGWTLFGLCMYGLMSRKWLITRGEADVYIRRAEVAESALARVNEQNADLVNSVRLNVAAVEGLRNVAIGVPSGDAT